MQQANTMQTRMTRQRAVILDELRKLHTHPTADELFKIVRARLPRISLGTVYRNLDLLADTGQILRLEVAGYTKRFDGNLMPHQHVRCIACGRVADVFPPLPVPSPEGVAVSSFACILSARIEFDGLCQECMEKECMDRICPDKAFPDKEGAARCDAGERSPESPATQENQAKEAGHV